MEKIIVIGPASQLLGMRTVIKTKLDFVQTEYKKFPDGECYIRIQLDDESIVEGKEMIIIQTLGASNHADQNQRIIELLMIISSLHRMGAKKVRVIVPYLAYARQDKVFRPGETLTANLICEMIEKAGADEFFTIDIHAEKILDSFTIPSHNLNPMSLLADYVTTLNLKDPVVISPDKGASKRSKSFAHFFGENVPVEVFSKERDVVTGDIKMTASLDVDKKDVIIADDIISTGGTMASAITIAKKSGARKIYAVGTHLLLIQDAIAKILHAGADKIIGTDTINNPFAQVSMADLLTDTILK
ncbi:MAG: ribose-phosphate diphosphokinase [Candidatus Lokiarchaeota archaeon]|nr:ribose-phosphate diphosphokinase [Candidatus Lokiarchaeota archaeon]